MEVAFILNGRVGVKNKNTKNSLMEVVEYHSASNVLVKFLEKGNTVKTTWDNFLKGKVGNPYDRTVYGIGYLGEGEYVANINRKHTQQYNIWKYMLRRCYDDKFHKDSPTYIGCEVSEEWHNFQNFAKWYDMNYYEVMNENIQLDKDILVNGNRIYSSSTCIFVPQKINSLFLTSDKIRGKLPLGVTYDKRNGKFIAKCKDGNGKTRFIGYYDDVEEASVAYIKFKKEVINKIANEYKSVVPIELYDAMISYEI